MVASKNEAVNMEKNNIIGNYKEFNNIINQLRHNKHYNDQLCVMYFELEVNHNHQTSIREEPVLELFSKYLLNEKAENDHVFNIQHNKFVVLTKGLSKSASIGYGNRIKRNFETLIDKVINTTKGVRVSVGLSIAKTNENLNETIRQADKALYLSKNQGAGVLIYHE